MTDPLQTPSTPKANSRTRTVKGVKVHYVEHGSGTPIIILHGAFSYHGEIEAALEPVFRDHADYRRIYPDLPGMGYTVTPDTVNSNNDVVDVMGAFINEVVGDTPFLLVGHSYGAYIARGIVAQLPNRVAGLALICPWMGMDATAPDQVAVYADPAIEGRLDPEQDKEFRGYFVVQSEEMLARYQESVAQGGALADGEAMERIMGQWELHPSPEAGDPYTAPALFLLGRQDSTVGYTDQWALLDHYPRATFAVLDNAGHALPHEQEGLLTALMSEWLLRVREAMKRQTPQKISLPFTVNEQ